METKITTLIALLLLSLGVTAQVDRTKQPKAGPTPKINIGTPKTFTLSNGLTVMVVENHKLPKVSASLNLNNRLIFEGDKAGVSSILAGMLGNGTTSISKDAYNEEIDFLGALVNINSQSASLNTLSKYFPRVLKLMAEGIKNPLLTQDEFDKQQQQLLTGIESKVNDVSSVANKVQNAVVYGKNHPYGEFATKISVKNLKLEDAKAFYNNYFVPNNAYLVIVGDVSFKNVKKLVKKNFSDWKKGTIPTYTTPKVFNKPQTEISFVNMPNAVQSNIAVINTVDLKMGNSDYFALLLANKILGGGGEGRLFLNLREDKGYTYGAYSRIGSNEKTVATYKAFATVRNTVTDSAVVEFVKEIKKFRNTKVSKEDLKAAKAAYIGNFVMAIEEPSTVANYAYNIATKNLSDDFYKTYLEKLNAVTINDIQRVAQKYFIIDNANIIIVGKATDVLPNLSKLPYKINYFDKEGNPTQKPELNKEVSKDVTVKSVLNKYIEAVGGMDAINKITSVKTVYEGSIQGQQLEMTTKQMTPNKYAMSMVLKAMGMEVTSIKFNGEKGAVAQQGVSQPMPEKMVNEFKSKTIIEEVGLLSDLDNISLEAIEKINGKDAYKIIVNKDGKKTTRYYDVVSGLFVKGVQKQGGMEQATLYEDYKDVNGIKFPHTVKSNMGAMVVEFKAISVLANEGVSNSDFE